MIRAYIFDIGNVLLPFDFGRAMRRLAPHCARPIATLTPEFKPVAQRLESGQTTGAQFMREAAELLGYSGPEAEFTAAWQDIFEENAPMTQLVVRLARSHPLYLLSNTNELHVRHFEAAYSVFAHFSGAVYSNRVGCMKPSREIFEIAVRQFCVTPEETVFIDDLAPNVAAGAEMGFRAFQYDWKRHEDLLDFLAALG